VSGDRLAVPLEFLQKLAPLAEKMGVTLPPELTTAPTISVVQPMRSLAYQLGRLLSAQNIFNKRGQVVTVDAKTGEVRPMTAKRFPSWAEEYCSFRAEGTKQKRDSLSAEDAAQVLETDIFLECLRPLAGVNTIVLPVKRKSGSWEWLPEGYDIESQVYTVDLLPYEKDWTKAKSVEFLNEHGANYPWAWPEEAGENRDLMENRSWSVQVAGMMGMYLHSAIEPGTLRPMIAHLANQPGTGKSTLASMILIPVFGHSATTDAPKDDAEMNKTLSTVANTAMPFVFFDDIGGGIYSNPLNRFITSESLLARKMGGNTEMMLVKNITQVFVTGNGIKISDDLMRRGLIAELFLAGDVAGRKFPKVITTKYLARPEVRAGFLSALCGLLKHYIEWIDGGGHAHHDRPLETFEEWTGLIGAIVVAGGFADPLAKPDLAFGGAEEQDEWRELLVLVASEAEGNVEFDRGALVEVAREHGLLEDLVGSKAGADMDAGATKRFGRQLQRWRGRELTDKKGRRFQFGHRKQKRGAKYPLTFIAPPAVSN
jgi:hypothetical protein